MAIEESASTEPPIETVALVADLIFAARIRGTAETLGARAEVVRTADALRAKLQQDRRRLVLLDLDARGVEFPELVGEIVASGRAERIVAFGAHVRTEALQAARDAGAHRVIPRSALVRDLADLLAGRM